MPRPTAGLEGDAHRLVDPADLLDRQAEAGEVAVLAEAGAAVLLRRGQPEQPELAHLLHDVDREVVVAVPLRGVRRDGGLGEVADAYGGTPRARGTARTTSWTACVTRQVNDC